ncbi:MAG: M24 family metallopeptidase [Alphaproteobacteria bacterium]
MRPFERSEHLARVAKTRARMEREGIEVLIATDPANMNYLSGYDGWSFYVHQLVMLALDADEPVWIGRAQDASGAKFTTYLGAENIVGYPDHYVQSAVRHPMDFVADVIKQRKWDRRTIGVEMDCYYFTAACLESLRKGLPNATFKNATGLVNWVRIVKSAKEIEYMRQAARIMERVMRVAVDAVRPGVRQCDAVAEIYHASVRGTPEYGGDYASIVPMLPTGEGSAAPHLTWSDETFKTGEVTVLELAAARHHYHCPMARTLVLAPAPPKIEDAAKVVVEGLGAALEAARPGATGEDVEGAWRRTIAKSGIVKDSRIGYSTGLNYPPDWGEHTISLRPGDKTVLEENMTIHCIPGIWMHGWGIEISECFRVTSRGGEPFCDYPRELIVKN